MLTRSQFQILSASLLTELILMCMFSNPLLESFRGVVCRKTIQIGHRQRIYPNLIGFSTTTHYRRSRSVAFALMWASPVRSDLAVYLVAMGAGVGPGVGEILGLDRRIGGEQGGVGGALAAEGFEKPDGSAGAGGPSRRRRRAGTRRRGRRRRSRGRRTTATGPGLSPPTPVW